MVSEGLNICCVNDMVCEGLNVCCVYNMVSKGVKCLAHVKCVKG